MKDQALLTKPALGKSEGKRLMWFSSTSMAGTTAAVTISSLLGNCMRAQIADDHFQLIATCRSKRWSGQNQTSQTACYGLV